MSASATDDRDSPSFERIAAASPVGDTTVIIAAFNQRHTLAMALAGLAQQTNLAFDVVVADDGSTDGTREYLRRAAPGLPFRLGHVWLEHQGYQRARALNAAVAAVESDYLIFIDGDCIPRRDFVEAHLETREPGFYLCGRDVRMSERFTRRVTREYVTSGRLNGLNLALQWDGMFGESTQTNRALPLGTRLSRYLDERREPTFLHGSNASVWRRDLDRVNGLDESYVNESGSDCDLGWRLSNSGVRPRSVRYRAIVFHCHHPKLDRVDRRDKARRHKQLGNIRCQRGLDGHSPSVAPWFTQGLQGGEGLVLPIRPRRR